jgi:hypothetical protein
MNRLFKSAIDRDLGGKMAFEFTPDERTETIASGTIGPDTKDNKGRIFLI